MTELFARPVDALDPVATGLARFATGHPMGTIGAIVGKDRRGHSLEKAHATLTPIAAVMKSATAGVRQDLV